MLDIFKLRFNLSIVTRQLRNQNIINCKYYRCINTHERKNWKETMETLGRILNRILEKSINFSRNLD